MTDQPHRSRRVLCANSPATLALPLIAFVMIVGAWRQSCFAGVASPIEMDVTLKTEGFQSRLDESAKFLLFPHITSVTGVSPDALVTIRSPMDRFSGEFENGTFSGSTSSGLSSSESVVDEVNGVWRVIIDEAGNQHRYNVDISFGLPFEELPHFESSTLVNGQPVGPIDWVLEGGSATFPGGQLLATLHTEGFGTLVDEAFLPGGTQNWNPNGDLSIAPAYFASIQTTQEIIDTDSVMVNQVLPMTPGAPTLTIRSIAAEYTAFRQAILVGEVIPEPGSLIMTFLVISVGLHWRPRFSGR